MAYANEEAIVHFHRVLGLLEGSAAGVSVASLTAEPPGERLKHWRLEALKELGQICLAVGDLADAEEHLQEAMALGREMADVEQAIEELTRTMDIVAGMLKEREAAEQQVAAAE